ncbi:spidroin-1-like [Rhipicephalus sanguineus]|uniref:spidroin-1-like n=1 Tax=Rhipicephalus sanguineus TaxID=34632 RepID=UPI001895F726|nr:spidroin-1-like [Rhipicephalus sanguineus]
MHTLKVLTILACAALAAAGSRSSSRGYSTPTAGYGDSSYGSYKGSKGSRLSYASLSGEGQQSDLSLGAPKVAKGILLSIRVVNPDESSGQPTYAAQVPIHFSGGRVTTGPVVYGREQPCPEDHVHGSRQLQSIVSSYSGGGSRGSRAYSPAHYQNALSDAKSYSVSQQIQVGVPSTAKTYQYHGQSYAVPVSAVPATASQEDAKSYVAYAGQSAAGPHYQQGYQVAQAPAAAYQNGAVSDGKGYPGTAYAHGGHAYQVVAQGGDGQEHVYVTAHPGAHGGHGGATAVAQKSYSPYAVQDTYSVEATPSKSYSGETGASGNAINGQQASYEVTDGGHGKGGYAGHAAYAAAPGYAGGPSYGGGGQGGASYAALVGRGYSAAAGPSYGGSAGPSYGGAAGPTGGYDKPAYQVAAVYPGAQPTYGVNAAAFKAAAAARAYGSYGGSASGGGEEQTIIVASDGPAGGDGSGKSYGSYQGAAGPSYQVASAAAQAYKPGQQQQQQQQQYAGPHQQAFSRYPNSGSGSYYSGTSFAEANRLALQKYNALMSRAASIVGGPQNLKAVTARYNIPWN